MVLVESKVASGMVEAGVGTSHANNRIEVVTPLPLEDLMYITDIVNKGHKHPEVQKLEVLGKGHFGTVWGYKEYAIKYIRGGEDAYRGYGDSNQTDELLDAYVLKQMQHIESIPKLYAVIDKTAIVIEKVDGMTMRQYREQMSDLKKMDNFISDNFIKAYKEAMKDILQAGLVVHDLHSDNVMVDRKTGLPKIIDVGLFKQVRGSQKEMVKNRDSIDFYYFPSVGDAIGYAQQLDKYIQMNKNPEVLAKYIKHLEEMEEERKREEVERENRKRRRAIKDKAENENLIKVKRESGFFMWRNNNAEPFDGEINHYIQKRHKAHDNKKEKDNVMVWEQVNIKKRKKDEALDRAMEAQRERTKIEEEEHRKWLERQQQREQRVVHVQGKCRFMENMWMTMQHLAPIPDIDIDVDAPAEIVAQQRRQAEQNIFQLQPIDFAMFDQWKPDMRWEIKKKNPQYAMKE